MATKMDSAEKAFEAATLEPAAKPATPAAPAVAEAAAPTPAKVEAPKTKTVKAKAKPVQKKAAKPATKAAPKKAAPKTIAPKIKVAPKPEIGRASCRDRVCQDVWISVVAVSLKKTQITTSQQT